MAKAMLQEALVDQSQVYLPINNALSSVGHVHGFIQELGQARTLNAIRLHPVASGCIRLQRCRSVGRRSSRRPSYVPLTANSWTLLRRASSTWRAGSTI